MINILILDNVVLQLNGVLFLKVKNPYLASYGVSEAEFAITQVHFKFFLLLSTYLNYISPYI